MNANDSKSDNRKSIGNVGVLDIRNATEESVDSIRSIGNVGTIVHSPETASLASRLSIGNVGNYFEVTGDFRTHNGHLTITRDFFKGLSSPLSLVVNGHIQVDADVEHADIEANLAGLSLNGHLMCPENLVGVIQGKIRNMNGHIQTYVPGDRLYLGRLRIDDTYLRTLPDDSTLTVVGRIVMTEIVSNELIAQKIAKIKHIGRMRIREENAEAILSRLDDSPTESGVSVIPEGFAPIDHQLVLDEATLDSLQSRKLYCTDWVIVDDSMDAEVLDSKLDALVAQGVVCPERLKAQVASKADLTQTRSVFYAGNLWLVEGELRVMPSRFEFMEGNATLVVFGELNIDSAVEPGTLAERLVSVHNFGEISGTADQIGAIQARLASGDGELNVSSQTEQATNDIGNMAHLVL